MPSYSTATPLKVLLLLEEHAEADDCPVDEEPAGYRHDHRLGPDEVRVRKNNGKR